MKVKILKDTTLTVKAGQIVEIDGHELPFLRGRVELVNQAEPVSEAEPEKAEKKKTKKVGK